MPYCIYKAFILWYSTFERKTVEEKGKLFPRYIINLLTKPHLYQRHLA